MCQGITKEKSQAILLKSEGLCQRKSSLEPAVRRIAFAILVQAIRDSRPMTSRSRPGSGNKMRFGGFPTGGTPWAVSLGFATFSSGTPGKPEPP